MRNLIYLSKINKTLSQDKFNDLLKVISKKNREKCQRFKFKEDALRTLYGELIIRNVLCKQFSFKNTDIEILTNEAGKPYVKNCSIHFNISHAGEYVVCAFSEQEIGIDIEQIKEVDLEIAKRFFCQCEYDDLLAQKITERLEYFYSLWTLKESYLKWLGLGMSIPLDSFYFKITESSIFCLDYNRKTMPFFKEFFIEGYKLSVCSMIHDFPDKIERVSIEEIIFYDD